MLNVGSLILHPALDPAGYKRNRKTSPSTVVDVLPPRNLAHPQCSSSSFVSRNLLSFYRS